MSLMRWTTAGSRPRRAGPRRPCAASRRRPFGGRLRPVEVAAHHVGASYDHLTGGAARQQTSRRVHDGNFLSWHGQAYCAGFAESVDGIHRRGTGAFRQPVALHDGDAVPAFEPLDELCGHRRGPARREPDGGGVGPLRLRQRCQRRVDRGYGREAGGPDRLDGLEERVRLEAPGDGDPAAREQR